MRVRWAWQVMVVVSVLSGCDCGSQSAPDASDAGGGVDAGRLDAGSPDAGARDAGDADAGERDAGERDAGEPDAGEPDAGGRDADGPDAGPLDAGEPDAGVPDAGWLVDGGVVRWTALTPPAVRRGGMTWDPSRQRVVRFGGLAGDITVADLWAWDGTQWTEIKTPNWPPTRELAGLTWDSARQRLFLFGGSTPNPGSTTLFRQDTWVLDGGAWADITDIISLGIISRGSLTWDPVHQQVIYLGEDGYSWLHSDGWRFGQSVYSRYPLLTWDRARSQAVALFGVDGFEQTWTSLWDGDAGSHWETLTPMIHPPGFLSGAIAWDPARQRVVAVVPRSQNTNPGGDPAETWEWDGLAWARVTSTLEPAVGSEFSMAYDESRNRMVLSGGLDLWGDVWERVGTQWQRVHEAPRGPDTLVFDERRNRMVTFGGASHTPDGGTTVCTNDTWEWIASHWERQQPSVSPPARCGAALAWDPVSERVVLFGGLSSGGTALRDMWSWDGAGWTQLTPPALPPARGFASMTFDPMRQRLVLLGGTDGAERSDLWEFDGVTWHLVAGPPVFGRVSMAWDSSRAQLLVVDDGATWTRADGGWTAFSGATPTAPTDDRPGFSNDPQRGRVVMLFANRSSPQAWEWDGSAWSRREVAASPATAFGTLAWDGVQQRVMMLGNGTWVYEP